MLRFSCGTVQKPVLIVSPGVDYALGEALEMVA